MPEKLFDAKHGKMLTEADFVREGNQISFVSILVIKIQNKRPSHRPQKCHSHASLWGHARPYRGRKLADSPM